MTINDLSVNFEHLKREEILSDWSWLTDYYPNPVMITLAGDAFLQSAETDEVFFLDTVEGKVERVADSPDGLMELLRDQEFVMERFSVNLVGPILEEEGKPEEGQLLSLEVPPVLNGEYSPDKLEPCDIEVHFSVVGQVWEQVKDSPEGATGYEA